MLKIALRAWVMLCVLALLGAGYSAAEVTRVRCYLVDARIHLALVRGPGVAGGQIAWRDTVTGASGELPYTLDGERLRLGSAVGGPVAEARVLPDLAIVIANPPWPHAGSRLSLGVALN